MKILLGIVIGWAVILVGAYVWAYSGRFPVATASKPLPFEVSLADTALHYASHRQAPKDVPPAASASDLTVAAGNYATDCAFCHGLPGRRDPVAAGGMFPPPPQFFNKVDDDPAGVTFWRIKNGIRLTGMPGFGGSLTDAQIWQLTFFLAQAKYLPVSAQQALTASSR